MELNVNKQDQIKIEKIERKQRIIKRILYSELFENRNIDYRRHMNWQKD